MRSFAASSYLVVRWALVGLVMVACSNSDFLDGVKCKGDDQCGRDRPGVCENGVCGGCPEGLASNGGCLCPGERIFDCRKFDASPRCMPVCPSVDELCQVVVVLPDGSPEELMRCTGPEDERCFMLMEESADCSGGQTAIHVRGVSSEAPVVVNCPPPESEDSEFEFECKEEG